MLSERLWAPKERFVFYNVENVVDGSVHSSVLLWFGWGLFVSTTFPASLLLGRERCVPVVPSFVCPLSILWFDIYLSGFVVLIHEIVCDIEAFCQSGVVILSFV